MRIDAAQDAGRSLSETLYQRGVHSLVFRSRSKIHPLCKRMCVCTNDYVSPNASRGANLWRPAKTGPGASCRVQPRLLRRSDTNSNIKSCNMKSSKKLQISDHPLFVYINNQDRKWRMSVLVFSSALAHSIELIVVYVQNNILSL